MASEWTLPLIRAELDSLPLGCDFILAADDAARLFGTGDATMARAWELAAGHGCRAAFRDDELVFQKRIRIASEATPVDPDTVECFPPLRAPADVHGDDHPGPGCR